MPSTYSSNLKIELMATGENANTWGDITNTNLGTTLEQAIVGLGNPVFASDANLTITLTNTNAAQAARALVLNATSSVSLTATRELVVPTFEKQYIVQNNTTGGQSITVKTSAGTGVTVPNGRKAHLYVDGTNVIQMFDFVDINGGTIDGTVVGGSSAAAGSFTTLSASSGVTFSGGTANGVLYLNGSKVATSGSALTFDGSLLGISTASPSSYGGRLNVYAGDIVVADAGTSSGASAPRLGSSAQALVFKTNSGGGSASEVARIDGSGNLGIGTTAPSARLEVAKGSEGTYLKVGGDSTGANSRALTFTSSTIDGSNGALHTINASSVSGTIAFATASTERLRIAVSGNVGIGTASPTSTLSVNGTANVTGSVTLGDATTDTVTVNGYMGVGTAPNSTIAFYARGTTLSGPTQTGVYSYPTGTSAATANVRAFSAQPATDASVFTVSSTVGFFANDAVKGAGSTITDLHGVYVANQTQGTNNYGITSLVSSGTNKWNIYASGTANNYFNGNMGLGITPSEWVGAGVALQSANSSHLVSSGANANFGANYYFNSTYLYTTTAAAAQYGISAGVHRWFTAPSGTVGTPISFTQVMTLDASGRLGIGTTSPIRPLHVLGTPTTFGSTRSVVQISDSSSFAAGVGGGLVFTGNSITGQTDALTVFAGIHAEKANSTSADVSGNLIFSTRLNGGNPAERMRIDSSGNVGIGTSSPTNTLSVAGNANITGNVTLGDASTDTVTVNGYMGVGGAGDSQFGIYLRNTALTGTTQRGLFVNVTGSSAGTNSIRGVHSNVLTAASLATNEAIDFLAGQIVKGSGSTITSAHGLYIAEQDAGTNNYGITSLVSAGANKWNIYASGTADNYFSGKVGIGTLAPGAKIESSVSAAGATAEVLRLSNPGAGANTQAQINFFISAASYATISGGYGATAPQMTFNLPSATAGNYVWQISTTERMRLNASGNLGIGTASPGARLQVASSAYTAHFGEGTGSAGIDFQNRLSALPTTGTVATIAWLESTAGFTAGSLLLGSRPGIGQVVLSSSGAADVILNTSGNLGLGVTPSAWGSGGTAVTALQLPNGASLASGTYLSSSATTLNQNAYNNAGWKYIGTGYAAQYFQSGVSGNHIWYTAPSGTAGNAISFTQAMTLNASSQLTVGTTTNTNSSTVVSGGTISETVSSTQYLVASQYDIGTAPNEIPINGYLGALAYEDSEFYAPAVGSGITAGTGTICKTSFSVQGGMKLMSVVIDLTGLNSGGTAGDIIGVNGTANPCYIALIPSTYTVLGGRMTCLETPAGGDTDIDLYSAVEGTGVEDQAITALTETQIINAGAQTRGTVTYFSADPAENTYFYLVGQGTANATYTAGRFLVEVFGA